MSTLLNITEKEYRRIQRNSYSSLSLFLSDRKAYYKKYVMWEVVPEKQTPQLTYGSLVDCLLFTPQDLDDRFVVSTAMEPKPQIAEFTRNLVKRVLEAKQEDYDGVSLSLAYNDTKYDKFGNKVAFKSDSFDTVRSKFENTALEYYRQLLDLGVGKLLITLEEYDKAELACETLRNHPTIGPIINRTSGMGIDVYKQAIIEFEYLGMEFKSMIDLLHVDHNNKLVTFYDLKTAWNVEEFGYNYLKYKYYIQAAIYYHAVLSWIRTNNLDGYRLLPIQFIVCDSFNYMIPLIYETNMDNLREGIYGFNINGRYYRGIVAAIEDIKWHTEKYVWNISRLNSESRGIVQLKTFEDENSGGQEEQGTNQD